MVMPLAERVEAVERFNALYGETERALWCLSRHCRAALLQGRGTAEVEALVWTLKSWWGVQGVRSQTKQGMAQALASLDWSEELFAPTSGVPFGAADDASRLVITLVERTSALGAGRREYSLASKVLHWLLPWRVPVYDDFVRRSLGVSEGDQPQPYKLVAQTVFRSLRELAADDTAWQGTVPPASPLRAIDKYLWWIGGGNAAQAAVVSDPWRPIDQLGLPHI
jgi:hypothetical protein